MFFDVMIADLSCFHKCEMDWGRRQMEFARNPPSAYISTLCTITVVQ